MQGHPIVPLNLCSAVEKYYGHGLAQGSNEIYNFGTPFLGHQYYIPVLSHPYPGVIREDLKKKDLYVK